MVELQPYQETWAEEFRREAQRIQGHMVDLMDAIEHIGSTAVPGLLAKPIIDSAARAGERVDPFGLGEQLVPLGYMQHTSGPKNHGVYVRGSAERRTHILHVFSADQWEHCNQRLFRDKLLRDESARIRYQALKESIAVMPDGRDYTAAKQFRSKSY